MKRHVVLVGLSGSGKSAAGRRAAIELGAMFVDIDGEIEAEFAKTIRTIFAEDGEEAFRTAESRAVNVALTESPQVIAPGAGWASQPGNLATVPENVFIIYLKTTPTEAARRLASSADRPLLRGATLKSDLSDQTRKREAYYHEADAVLETDGRTLEDVAKAIAALARKSAGW